LFQNNAVGLTNVNGAGHFQVNNSIFQNSTTADISMHNTGVFNFRNNYSIGSRRFVNAGGTCANDNVTIEGNTILDTTDPRSINQADIGPAILIDNVIRSAPGVSTGPIVRAGIANCPADVFSMGNTFSATSPLGSGTSGTFRSQSIG